MSSTGENNFSPKCQFDHLLIDKLNTRLSVITIIEAIPMFS